MLGLLSLMAFAAWQYKTYARPLEFTAAAVFTLHPVSGLPLIVSDYYRFYFDWEGNPLMVQAGALPPGGQPRKRIKHYWNGVHEVRIGMNVLHSDDEIVCTTVQPHVPAGWQRLIAVTTGRERKERLKEYIIAGESFEDTEIIWEQYSALFYDYRTTELLAEINLNCMYNTLYAHSSSNGYIEANVRSACLSPSGELAIIIYFMDESGFWYEKGIWRDEAWVPLPENQPFWQIEYPLYVGPGGWSVYNLRNGDSGYIAFYDPRGQLSAKYTRSKESWTALAFATLRKMRDTAAAAAVVGFLAVLLLAFIWHFIVPSVPRRRLESRRAHPQ
jgi:hypothetical protein